MNITTIEECNYLFKRNKPFDKGSRANWEDIYGKNYGLFQIFFPIKK